jgi:carbon-monoxide dehydrogenase small subunit
MEVLLPRTLEEALELAASNQEVVPIAGGTDVMVELNMDLGRPETLMDVSTLPELAEWRRENGHVFLGAGVTYTRIMRELPEHTALVQASRSVGSPQIRNRGTVGGNLGTGSPAGDALPVLAAWDAEIVLARAGGSTRSVPWREFLTGVKQTARTGLLLEDRDAERDGDRGREPVPAGRRGRPFDPGGARVRRADGRPSGGRRDLCGAGVRGRWSVGRSDGVGGVRPDRTVRRARRGRGETHRRRPRDERVSAPRLCRDGPPSVVVGDRGPAFGGWSLMLVRANVNGERRETDVWPGSSLLYLLREHLGLPGSKNACEQGECGSCSVWLDGELVCACLVLAAQANGREVRTVEGLAAGEAMHPVQEAFVETGAVQCGFCTPGFVVAVADLLEQVPEPPEAVVREALSGNLCRCTGYEKILEAVRLASDRMRIREDEL